MRLNCEKNYPKINKLFSLTSKILGSSICGFLLYSWVERASPKKSLLTKITTEYPQPGFTP